MESELESKNDPEVDPEIKDPIDEQPIGIEMFKILPFIYPFVLNIEVSEENDTKPELVDFLRKMNIQHSFKQMPGKAIKLNIPFLFC